MQEDTTEKGAESPMNNRKDGKANILPQVRIAIVASLGLLITGNIGGWTGSVLTKMGTDFEMTATENSLVVSLASYGSLVGSIFSGKGMDIFGRRKLMLAAAPVTACGWALIGIATNIYVVYIGRFVCGLSSGILFTSSSVYPYTINAFGESVVFLFYGILCFVFAGGTLLFVPETKGKSLEEIQEYFERRALKKNEKDLNETTTN